MALLQTRRRGESHTVITEDQINEARAVGRNEFFASVLDWYLHDLLDAETLNRLLWLSWVQAEWPMRVAAEFGMNTKDVVAMFRQAGFVSSGARLPEHPLRVFRGSTEEGVLGLSWTTSEGIARWFARRNKILGEQGSPVVSSTDIAPEYILAMFVNESERGECEVVIDPMGLSRDRIEIVRDTIA